MINRLSLEKYIEDMFSSENGDQLKKFNKLKVNNPKELLTLMDNIQYGYVNNKNKTISKIDPKKFVKDYKLQSPEELYISKHGVCWDQVEFERYFFEKMKIKHICVYIELGTKNSTTHTFIIFEEKNKKWLFEHSYDKYKGIHGPFDKNLPIIKDVYEKMVKDEEEKPSSCSVFVLDKPEYGLGCQEYMDFARSGLEII